MGGTGMHRTRRVPSRKFHLMRPALEHFAGQAPPAFPERLSNSERQFRWVAQPISAGSQSDKKLRHPLTNKPESAHLPVAQAFSLCPKEPRTK